VANAPAADQRRLLDVQEADLQLTQARHRRANLPVIAQIEELTARAADMDEERIARGTEVGDLQREVTKAEDDVQAVRSRAQRDQQRLDSGEGTSKDLQALQSELEVLANRQGALEDIEIEVMERLETAEKAQADAVAQHEQITAQIAQLTDERDQAQIRIDAEIATLEASRAEAVQGLDATLVALYEKQRAQHGVGAAALTGTTCEGCHMSLNPVDMGRIKAAPADQVVRCEECGCILVREVAA
jgi:predicted  nucleic acid-binding Zn-ribbon protein